ncbi:SCO family protein [Mucilaginibacter terrae]|uniref:SCO family protein n=1 Tax=Mucilaginibacter terrae TaxID=1955052 RepID=UPI00363CD2C2
MNNLSLRVKKLIILVLILAVPGFLYYLLTVKGKNRYRPLVIYGPKQVAKTGHTRRGKYIPDTIYHKLGDFKLTDQLGKPVTLKDFEYKIFVVSFLYTHCSSVCNEVNKNMERLAHAYRKNRMVRFVTITVDPERDTPAALLAYSKRFGVAPDKWRFLTGDSTVIYNLVRNGFLENALKADNEFVFSDKMILIDADKRIRGRYTGTSLPEAIRLNDEIKVQIAEELRKIKAPD